MANVADNRVIEEIAQACETGARFYHREDSQERMWE